MTATYVLNRVLSKSVSSTPYELWTHRKPNLTHLHPWGSATYVHNPSHKHGKLDPRGKKCIFIRYPEYSKWYVFIGEHDDRTITKIKSRDVTFLENEFLSISEVHKDVHLYELNDSEMNDTSDLQIERNLDMSGNSDSNGSQPQNDFTPLDNSI